MTATHSPDPVSAAGLLLSLASALPEPTGALGRRAARMARLLRSGRPVGPSVAREAADLTADLLTATDDTLGYADPDLLDDDFDL